MKNSRWLFAIAVVSALFGLAALLRWIASNHTVETGGMMMGRDEMKKMMSQMMGNALPTGIAPQDIPDPKSHGAKLLSVYCIQCHNLPNPAMHSASEWPAVANRMFFRMSRMSGMMGMMRIQNPSLKEKQTIMAYLQAHALKAISPGAIPDVNSRGAVLFSSVCSQCHALPDPKFHTAAQWPSVVERMRKNIVLMKKKKISKTDLQEIEKYLMSHAKT